MNICGHFITAALIALPLLGGATLAHADALENIKTAGKIRIAIDPGLPPWSFKDNNLQLTGSEYETAKMLAKDLGVEMEVVETNGANRIPLLMTGKADIVVAAMTITDERKKTIDFSRPYSGTSTAVSAPVDMKIASLDDLVGKSIAVARGTIMDSDITKMAPPGVEIVRFDDEATTVTSILSGQMDIVAQSLSLNETIKKRDPSKALEPKIVLRTNMHGIGMRKGEDSLRNWIDAWVKRKMQDGTLPDVYQKFQGIALPEGVKEAALK
ncbi:transporter substrate-binding domain-containing protein [Agrobacterium rhizogenes]|uniref:transporter substrate-binding domain-containing protein n=1 Tax=Rhizobium rhizogenes TaxID=359 RepID=UPI0015742807|nr:transporter substrate-binding domain-containing protein [Rhizobium rhizogenes]NTH16593.1 transporter substrate-binding domain-containing protein [Rhizobium rhizogenes]